jgi:hypothetical protein
MPALFRCLAITLLSVLLPVLAVVLHPSALAAIGLDLDFPGIWEANEREHQRAQELASKTEKARAQEAAKDQICRDLIAGRMPLRAAAAHFRGQHPSQEDLFWRLLSLSWEGGTEEARLAHYVIYCVRELLESEGRLDEANRVSARLEQELREQPGAKGILLLPEMVI